MTDCVLYETIDQVPLEQWNEVCQGAGRCFMSTNFLRAMERTQPDGAKTFHAMIYEQDGKPCACASLSLFPVDLLMLAGQKIRDRVGWVRRVFPKLGFTKILMCGQPFSAGQSHLVFAPGTDRLRVLKRLDALLKQLAQREGATVIVFKEFADEDCADMDGLQQCDYWRADSPPLYDIAKPFENFAAYRAALKNHYRARVRRSERNFEQAGCSFVRLEDPVEIAKVYTPEVHALYEAVVERSDVKLEVLSRESFLELVRELPGQVCLTAAYRQNRLIGFAWDLTDGREFHCLFLGMDYSQNVETDLYFNLVAKSFDCAFRSGAEIIHVGQTSDSFKALLGCAGKARYLYARGVGPLLSWVLRKCSGLLFPPRHPLPAHDVFKSEAPAPTANTLCNLGA
jgi:predicted N-acyltransferase